MFCANISVFPYQVLLLCSLIGTLSLNLILLTCVTNSLTICLPYVHVYVHGVGCSAFTKSAIIAVKSITTHDNVVQGPGNLVAIIGC